MRSRYSNIGDEPATRKSLSKEDPFRDPEEGFLQRMAEYMYYQWHMLPANHELREFDGNSEAESDDSSDQIE